MPSLENDFFWACKRYLQKSSSSSILFPMNIQGRHGTFGCISSSFEALLLNIVEFEPAAHRSYYEIICCWLSTFKLPQWQYVWLYHIWGQVKAPFLAFVLDNSFLAKNRFVQVIERMKLLFVVIHSIFYWLHQNNYNEKAGKISLLKWFLPFFSRASATVVKLLLQKMEEKIVELVFIPFCLYLVT